MFFVGPIIKKKHIWHRNCHIFEAIKDTWFFFCYYFLPAGRLGVTVCPCMSYWTLSLSSCLGQDNSFSLLHWFVFSVFVSFILCYSIFYHLHHRRYSTWVVCMQGFSARITWWKIIMKKVLFHYIHIYIHTWQCVLMEGNQSRKYQCKFNVEFPD